MDNKRFLLFVCLASLVLVGYSLIMQWIAPAPPPQQPLAGAGAADAGAGPADQAADGDAAAGVAGADDQPDVDEPAPHPPEQPAQPAGAEWSPQDVPVRWLTLGSADAAGPYRMLAVLCNAGAVLDRAELNGSFHVLEPEVPRAYFGPLAADDADDGGAVVHVVAPGTAAAQATSPAVAGGLLPGDVVLKIGDRAIARAADIETALAEQRVGRPVEVLVRRAQGGAAADLTFSVTPQRRPLAVVSRERNPAGGFDPASFVLRLASAEGEVAETPPPEQDLAAGHWDVIDDPDDLARLGLDAARWDGVRPAADEVVFAWPLVPQGVLVLKRYRIAAGEAEAEPALPGYHLDVSVELVALRDGAETIAYRLEGPTGLPTEGWWYANKVSHNWSGAGVRDVLYAEGDKDIGQSSAAKIAQGEATISASGTTPIRLAGVDAQYFSAILLPQGQEAIGPWVRLAEPIAAGPVPPDKNLWRLTNATIRLDSKPQQPAPDAPIVHRYRVFLGPKDREMLAAYGLGDLLEYGWFAPVSRVLVGILHFFGAIVGNYGLAVVLLTALVRGCMFPLSWKQTRSAQKMQELQPEMKRISERYKNDLQQRNAAMQELWRKHNYNPLGGCLLIFIQLPIFMGLYRALMVNVELREKPLVPGLGWADNLAAPDMLFRWEWLPVLSAPTGLLSLGPYFNLLPVVTVALFLWQQKLFMPPPTDEQSAMQQRVMKWMMAFMAIMFFKVPAGLCVYVIASSLWGIAERKLLPKLARPAASAGATPAAAAAPPRATSKDGGNGAVAPARRKQRRK